MEIVLIVILLIAALYAIIHGWWTHETVKYESDRSDGMQDDIARLTERVRALEKETRES